jgi:hypothetical protein
MSTDLGYPPPVTMVGSGTRAADATGVLVTIAGGSNQPAPGSTTQNPAGGSPSEESGRKYASTVVSISPTTIAHTAADTTCTVTGTNFSTNSRVLYGGAFMTTTYVSPTSLTFTLPVVARTTTGVVTVGAQTGSLVTNTVNFTYT